eukprot:2628696-Pleurochrysis_carterae.AAC.2
MRKQRRLREAARPPLLPLWLSSSKDQPREWRAVPRTAHCPAYGRSLARSAQPSRSATQLVRSYYKSHRTQQYAWRGDPASAQHQRHAEPE